MMEKSRRAGSNNARSRWHINLRGMKSRRQDTPLAGDTDEVSLLSITSSSRSGNNSFSGDNSSSSSEKSSNKSTSSDNNNYSNNSYSRSSNTCSNTFSNNSRTPSMSSTPSSSAICSFSKTSPTIPPTPSPLPKALPPTPSTTSPTTQKPFPHHPPPAPPHPPPPNSPISNLKPAAYKLPIESTMPHTRVPMLLVVVSPLDLTSWIRLEMRIDRIECWRVSRRWRGGGRRRFEWRVKGSGGR